MGSMEELGPSHHAAKIAPEPCGAAESTTDAGECSVRKKGKKVMHCVDEGSRTVGSAPENEEKADSTTPPRLSAAVVMMLQKGKGQKSFVCNTTTKKLRGSARRFRAAAMVLSTQINVSKRRKAESMTNQARSILRWYTNTATAVTSEAGIHGNEQANRGALTWRKELGRWGFKTLFIAGFFGVGVLFYRYEQKVCTKHESASRDDVYRRVRAAPNLLQRNQVFTQIAGIISRVTEPVFDLSRRLLERIMPAMHQVMLDGHEGGASYEEPAGPISYYAQNLLAPVIMTFVLQIVFAIIFIFLEGWDFWSGLYHCFVTITTVGYGDTPLTTDGGKVCASVHILLSICIITAFITDLNHLKAQRKRLQQRARLLKRKLDPELITSLDRRALALDSLFASTINGRPTYFLGRRMLLF
ncbi:MAG: hypothetical protein SGPRY_013195 [Prymnesium sp.]